MNNSENKEIENEKILRVLIAEDEENIRDLYRDFLELLTFKPPECYKDQIRPFFQDLNIELILRNNGNEALEFIKQIEDEGKSIDGIISDNIMPGGLTGLELAEKYTTMKKPYDRAPFFIISGNNLVQELKQDEKKYGAVWGFKKKPFLIESFAGIIETMIFQKIMKTKRIIEKIKKENIGYQELESKIHKYLLREETCEAIMELKEAANKIRFLINNGLYLPRIYERKKDDKENIANKIIIYTKHIPRETLMMAGLLMAYEEINNKNKEPIESSKKERYTTKGYKPKIIYDS